MVWLGVTWGEAHFRLGDMTVPAIHDVTTVASAQVVGPGDKGSTVTVSVGTAIEIRLPENPTTGYKWELVPIIGLPALTSDKYVLQGKSVGAGGERCFTITPLGFGHAEIRLFHRRAWEPPEASTESFGVLIIAK